MTPEQATRILSKQRELRARFLASPRYVAARSVAGSPAGRVLLEWLEEQFDGDDLLGESVEETYFNLGARALFRELRRVATAGERTGDGYETT